MSIWTFSRNMVLMVVAGDGQCLLGRNWLVDIKISWKDIIAVSTHTPISLLDKFRKIFSDKLNAITLFKAGLHAHPDAQPMVFKTRPAPFAVHVKQLSMNWMDWNEKIFSLLFTMERLLPCLTTSHWWGFGVQRSVLHPLLQPDYNAGQYIYLQTDILVVVVLLSWAMEECNILNLYHCIMQCKYFFMINVTANTLYPWCLLMLAFLY